MYNPFPLRLVSGRKLLIESDHEKILLLILPLLSMMSSGIKDEAVDCPSCKDKVRFTLQVQEEGVQYVTRATDEQTVRDVNLFLYDPRGMLPTQHFYAESGAIECSMPWRMSIGIWEK